MTKNILIGVGVLILIGLGIAGLSYPTSQIIIQDDGGRTVGSISGPDINYPYLSVSGVTTYYSRTEMRKATTTLCAILSPVATSTITSVSWIIGTGTTTASAITIATSTSQYATSTSDELVADTSVASGAQGYATWSGTGGSVNDNMVGPSTYVLVRTAGAGLGGYSYTGQCQAEFRQL